MRIALATAMAALALAGAAHASDVTFGYDHGLGCAKQLNGQPIDCSRVLGSFSMSGPVIWGADIEASQNGRAGTAGDKFGVHVAHAFALGALTVTPSAQLGYARALDLDYGYGGAELRASMPQGPLISELAVRYRHGFATNLFPLNSADLPHTRWHELRFENVELFQMTPRFALGVRGAIDRGSQPDKVIGLLARISF